MDMVSSEIASAIHQVILNGAALLGCTQSPTTTPLQSMAYDAAEADDLIPLTKEKTADPLIEVIEEENGEDFEILEMDAVELVAEHVHFCEICGKGFKRDANLRMHMRAHGNQFKTHEALAKPGKTVEFGVTGGGVGEFRKTRFSCPYVGCNRNKQHKKFRPLKSVICVKNHYKRSHCPKMYSCNRCNTKRFSVFADLKSHMKHCGETKWKCSCGTSFSRKDKLFGHMALFEGHMPAVVEEEEEKGKEVVVVVEDDDDDDMNVSEKKMEVEKWVDDFEMFDGLRDGFDSIDNYCFQDLLGSSSVAANDGLGSGVEESF